MDERVIKEAIYMNDAEESVEKRTVNLTSEDMQNEDDWSFIRHY